MGPEYSLEGLMLKLKLQYFGYLMQSIFPDAGKDWRQEQKRVAENKMAGWHHQLNGHELEQTLGDSEGLGNLECCSPRGRKESDTTELLSWTEAGLDCCNQEGPDKWKREAGGMEIWRQSRAEEPGDADNLQEMEKHWILL